MLLTFPKDQVAWLLAHTLASETFSPSLNDLFDPNVRKDGREPPPDVMPRPEDVDPAKLRPGLFLVGDHGVYLMSNGQPPLLLDVAYARECDPTTLPFDDWWAAKRQSFGGDDGAEFLAATGIQQWLDRTAGSNLEMDLSPTGIKFVFDAPDSTPGPA